MNYIRIYNDLVERGQLRQVNKNRKILKEELGYVERHHIIPRCLNGGDNKENLVYLTAEEHFIAHQLLIKIHPEIYDLVHAVAIMCVDGQNGERVNNKMFGWIKKKNIEACSKRSAGINNPFYGKKHAQETIERMSGENNPMFGKCGVLNPFFGKTHTDEFKKRKSRELVGVARWDEQDKEKFRQHMVGELNPNFGRNFSEEHRRKLSESHKGISASDKCKQVASKTHKGVPKLVVKCPYCNKSGGKNIMNRWHFDNCRENSIIIRRK